MGAGGGEAVDRGGGLFGCGGGLGQEFVGLAGEAAGGVVVVDRECGARCAEVGGGAVHEGQGQLAPFGYQVADGDRHRLGSVRGRDDGGRYNGAERIRRDQSARQGERGKAAPHGPTHRFLIVIQAAFYGTTSPTQTRLCVNT